MSATAIIHVSDIPPDVFAKRALRHDDATGAELIAFDHCPLTGTLGAQRDVFSRDMRQTVTFPFPRGHVMRTALTDWLLYHGISFTVIA